MSQRFVAHLAISNEERLERMRENMRRDLPRLKPQAERDGVLAVCGFGPSLRETWKEIRTPHVLTTSGAHDFLIERGIVPTWHVEFDPRPHKAFFLRKPRKETTYAIASTCNANLFEALVGQRVLIWHGMGGDGLADADAIVETEGDDGIMLMGGSTAGLRAFVVGHVLGFRQFELFGLDCSYDGEATWAGPHSGQNHGRMRVKCNGKEFLTSDTMLNAAEELFDFLGQIKGSQVKIHGEHLFAERIRLLGTDRDRAFGKWWTPVDFQLVRAPIFPEVKETEALISDGYRELNRRLHQENAEYGASGHNHAVQIKNLMRLLQTTDVLDYGCGKRTLERALGIAIKNYDPAIADCDMTPDPAEIVVCCDTLEHIEIASLAAVLRDLQRVTRRLLFVTVACYAAMKTLADGRNAHLIIQPPKWWVAELKTWFDMLWAPIIMQDAQGRATLCAILIPKVE